MQRLIAFQQIDVNKTFFAIHRIKIESVDSVIHPLNNRGLDFRLRGLGLSPGWVVVF